jgi:two-component system chemotaxis response regulator CheY
MKILVVDDSRTMRKIIRNALEGMGYSPQSVLEAADGTEALSLLEGPNGRADIVLADWNMPSMDGLSLLRRMQESPTLGTIPLIMVTGEAQRDKVVEAIKAGARNYIVKPFTPETLRQKVLAIEMELLAARKPTDTAVMRFNMAQAKDKGGNDLPFIAQLPEELVAGIYEAARSTTHQPGEVLIEPGDAIGCLFVIDRGEVEVDCTKTPGPPEIRGRGECVGEIPFLSGDSADLCAKAKTETVLLSVEKDAFEDLLAEYPHLSFYLTRLLARRASKATVDTASSLSGRLNMMTIAELVQSLHHSQKSGVLTVTSGSESGTVTFEGGNVRNAKVGDTEGEEAFYQLVSWADGCFEFEAGASDAHPSIFKATMSLLMEGMRRQDELRRMRA